MNRPGFISFTGTPIEGTSVNTPAVSKPVRVNIGVAPEGFGTA